MLCVENNRAFISVQYTERCTRHYQVKAMAALADTLERGPCVYTENRGHGFIFHKFKGFGCSIQTSFLRSKKVYWIYASER